jgi:DnaJ-class molecular chaperone
MKVPAGMGGGKTMRLKGKGVTNKGDLLVKFTVVLPSKPDKALDDFITSWSDPTPNPRSF